MARHHIYGRTESLYRLDRPRRRCHVTSTIIRIFSCHKSSYRMQFSKYATVHKKPLQTHENIGLQTCQFLQKCLPEGKRLRDIVEVVKTKLILNVYSCFLRRNSVIFVRLVINNLLYLIGVCFSGKSIRSVFLQR